MITAAELQQAYTGWVTHQIKVPESAFTDEGLGESWAKAVAYILNHPAGDDHGNHAYKSEDGWVSKADFKRLSEMVVGMEERQNNHAQWIDAAVGMNNETSEEISALHRSVAQLTGRVLGLIRSYNIHRHDGNPTLAPQKGHVIPE